MKNKLFAAAIGLVVLVILGHSYARPALAQARAALVQVTNTAATPVPTIATDNPANEPFAWEVIARSPVNTILSGSFPVPSTTEDGKNVNSAVIEYVSTLCSGTATPANGVRVTNSVTNNEQFFPFQVGPNPSTQVLGQATRLYASPSQTVFINLLEFTDTGNCSFSVSGYYVTQ